MAILLRSSIVRAEANRRSRGVSVGFWNFSNGARSWALGNWRFNRNSSTNSGMGRRRADGRPLLVAFVKRVATEPHNDGERVAVRGTLVGVALTSRDEGSRGAGGKRD